MIKVIGGKIILHSKDDSFTYALEISNLNVSEGTSTSVSWVWVSEGDAIKVKESFDDILEAIEEYQNEKVNKVFITDPIIVNNQY